MILLDEKDKKYQKIVKKVKGLLAISRDQRNDEESQSAFLLAQKLMMEYQINKHDVEETEIDQDDINEESVTIFKRMYWWERKLGSIIAKNFRLKMFYERKHGKSRIKFYGFGKDLELGKEMFILAYEVLLFHSKEFINNYYESSSQNRTRYFTESLKSSYISGFLLGLEKRFSEQIAELREQYEVLVLIPKEVEKSFKEYSADFKPYSIEEPAVEVGEAYRRGYETGSEIDFTRSTIDG